MSLRSGTVVRVERAAKRYGETTAVVDLSLEVREGEMFGLIGPDGAGKTTTLRMVLGLLEPDAGELVTCGLDPMRERRKLSSRVGYLSQKFSLYGDLTVDENVAFFAEIHGVDAWRPLRDELLETMRLTPFRRRLADRLSGGMKQKLALACTLVHTPELLVLDEPTTGVDPVSRRDFWKLLVRLQREGLSILLATPYLDEAERCERVALVHRGHLLALDTPTALRESSRGTLVAVTARPSRRAAEILAREASLEDVVTFGNRLHVTLETRDAGTAEREAARIARLLTAAGIDVDDSRVTRPSLEDVFIERIEVSP